MVPFVIGILVSASIIGVVTLLPIFQSNMLVYFFFTNPNGNFSNSNILPTVVEISDEGGGGEAVTLAAHSSQFCSGTSIFEHHGTIEITTYTSDQKSQTLSVVIPSVSVFDMITITAGRLVLNGIVQHTNGNNSLQSHSYENLSKYKAYIETVLRFSLDSKSISTETKKPLCEG